MITLKMAREMAERSAELTFSNLVSERPIYWLRDEVIGEKNCWLFLKSKDLKFRDEAARAWAAWAIVISKRGKEIAVADHYEYPVSLRQYLAEISDYLEIQGE
jgi:hypothetical protein